MLQRFVEIYAQNAPLFLLLVTWDDYVELLHLSLSTWRQWAAFVCLKVYQTTSQFIKHNEVSIRTAGALTRELFTPPIWVVQPLLTLTHIPKRPGVKYGCADVATGKMRTKMRINICILPAHAPSVTEILLL